MRYLAVWTVGLIGLLALAIAPGAALAQSDMTTNVTPASGPPGARFAFMATGFDSEERVAVWANMPDGAPMAITAEELHNANSDGRADWYWTVPSDAAPGMWQMVAHGVDSNVERVMNFEVMGAPATPLAERPANTNVTPSEGPAGTRFAFAAIGFDPDESIAVWVNMPDGTPMAITAEELNSANGDGRADWYWTSPDDAAPGMWQMVAHGRDSGTERVIPFMIR